MECSSDSFVNILNKLFLSLVLLLQGCAVAAVTAAGITVVATGVKITAKALGAIADKVLPI